jgi:hypothetical protein
MAKYNFNISSPGPQTVYENKTVHEHRAPTDKSVELLKEFEEKAESKLVERIIIDNNIMGDILVFEDAMVRSVRMRFKLNGRDYEIEDKQDIMRVAAMDPHYYITKFYEFVSETIAQKLIQSALESSQPFQRCFTK